MKRGFAGLWKSRSANKLQRLVFHIGDHKCGSTSIQNAFAAGGVQLDGHGLLYPGNENHNYLRALVSAAAEGRPEPESRAGRPNLTRIGELIADSNADFCLLSGEAFEHIDPNVFRAEVTQRFGDLTEEIRIISYVRPHASRILSNYAEQTKVGWYDGTPKDYFQRMRKSKRFFYAPRLRAWRACFGDQFIVRPMVRGVLKNGDVLDDFVETAFDGIAARIDATGTSNESLTLQDLVLLRYLHRHLKSLKKGVRHGFGWEYSKVAQAFPQGGDSTRLRLHRRLARKIRKTYAEDAAAVDKEFFGDKGLFTQALDEATETATARPQSLEPEDYFSASELRNLSVLGETLGVVMSHPDVDWPGFFRDQRATARPRGSSSIPG